MFVGVTLFVVFKYTVGIALLVLFESLIWKISVVSVFGIFQIFLLICLWRQYRLKIKNCLADVLARRSKFFGGSTR